MAIVLVCIFVACFLRSLVLRGLRRAVGALIYVTDELRVAAVKRRIMRGD